MFESILRLNLISTKALSKKQGLKKYALKEAGEST